MRIKVIAISWNEEMIAPYFLRHYSSFADSITIYDNNSTDNTCEILKDCEIIKFDTNNTFNDDEHRDIKNNAWKMYRGQYDWIILCDMDEFIYAKDIRKELKETLNKATIIRPNGYNMVADKFPTTNGMIYDEIKSGALDTNYSKSIIIDPHKIEQTNYNWGSHLCMPKGDVKVFHTDSIKLLHYKWLGLDYVLKRHQTYKERLSQFNLIKNLGEHYRYSKEKITNEYEQLKLNSNSII